MTSRASLHNAVETIKRGKPGRPSQFEKHGAWVAACRAYSEAVQTVNAFASDALDRPMSDDGRGNDFVCVPLEDF